MGQSSRLGQWPSRGLTGSNSHSSSSSSSAATPPPLAASVSGVGIKLEFDKIRPKEASEDIIPEIVVSIDNMEFLDIDMDSDNADGSSLSPPPDEGEDEGMDETPT